MNAHGLETSGTPAGGAGPNLNYPKISHFDGRSKPNERVWVFRGIPKIKVFLRV